MLNSESRSPAPSDAPRESNPSGSRSGIDKRPRIDSQQLLQGGRELSIAHAGEEYRLRLTRNDKLILTK